MIKVIRYIVFYGSWIVSASAPRFEYPILVSYACFLPLLALTFWGQKNIKRNIVQILGFGFLGLLMDSILTWFGYFTFPSGHDLFWPFVPIWYFPLWFGFVISMIDLAIYFKNRIWLAGLLGSAGGPLSFLAGEKLGAIQIQGPIWILVVLWFFVTCLLTWGILKTQIPIVSSVQKSQERPILG